MNCNNEEKQQRLDQLLVVVVLYGTLDKAFSEYMIKEGENFSLNRTDLSYISQ